jgi:diguanylate cyclase (GGDEF)-like protein
VVTFNRQFDAMRHVAGGRAQYLSRSVIATWAAAFAFVAILILGWTHAKSTIEQQLRDHVHSMAQLAADRTALTFDTTGKALQTLGDGIQASDLDASRPDRQLVLQTMLIRARGRNPSLVSLVITDPGGRILASSPFHSSGASLLTRPKEVPPLTPEDRDVPAMSTPFLDPASGHWHVRMSSRVTGANGLTAGMLIAEIAIGEALVRFFNHYPIGNGDSVSLHDSTDRLLAVFPPNHAATFSRVIESGGTVLASAPPEAVTYMTDGERMHLVATRKLPRYPYYVVYGEDIDDWLLRWRQEQFVLAFAALAAIVVTAAITTGIQRRLALTGQLQTVRGDLEESNAALRSTLAAAELLAARDQLTGLCNRRNFDQRLEAAIARTARHGDEFSLLMIDLDHFKNVNDYYGHATGDDVLRRFGEVLRERLRQNDVAARWGGEEFAVLADGANLDNARLLAEQIREAVAQTSFPPVPRVTVSIGIAEYQEGETGDDLLRRADKALYGAKRNGRNRVIAAEGSQVVRMQTA